MADFSTFRARRSAFDRSAGIVDRVLAVYQAAAGVRDVLADYQGGADADLITAINATFTPAQRAELGQVAQACATLATALETDHAGIVGLISG